MAFVFTPVYQTPQYSPFGFSAPACRRVPVHRGCSQRRSQYNPFNNFFGQVDELLSEIDRQAQRQAHCEAVRKAHAERQQRKRALRAKFTINQTEAGWQVDGDIKGFEQENLSIEVTDDHTLKISGNTEWQSEVAQPQDAPVKSATETTPDVAAEDAIVVESATPTLTGDSDTESVKSHQATVEDDFEDLGADASSFMSAASETSTAVEPKESKGKEKVIEEEATAAPEPESQPQEQEQQQERVHGSFERAFKFPERIDAANVTASFKDGNLTIVVPKVPVQEVKRISIA